MLLCRAVIKDIVLYSCWSNSLDSPQPSQKVGKIDGARTYRNIMASRNSVEDRIVSLTCEGKTLSQRPAVFVRFRI